MSAIARAISDVCERFPIEGYMTPIKHEGAYATIANTALRYLQPGARILDFGCGPCDKLPPAARTPYLLVTKLFNNWKDTWLMVARKKKGWQPRRSLTSAEQRSMLPHLPW